MQFVELNCYKNSQEADLDALRLEEHGLKAWLYKSKASHPWPFCLKIARDKLHLARTVLDTNYSR